MKTALEPYTGRHAGESVIVCGCGASARELLDVARPVVIGVNDIGRLLDPDYLVVINPRSQFKPERWRAIEQSRARALFTQLEPGAVQPPVVRFRLGRYGGTEPRDDGTLHYTQNSPYVGVCLATLMGARRIGLIGVDFTDHHFFGSTGRHALARQLALIDAQYGRLANALAARGVELVNLSSVSRLQSLPRMRLQGDGLWTAPAPRCAPSPPAVSSPPQRPAMKIAIEKRSPGPLGDLMEALAATAARLGHRVSRDPRSASNDAQTLSIVWNGRGHRGRGPVLYCEHGWLPRSDYQISPRGINAGSHLAPFRWNGQALDAARDATLDAQFAAIRAKASAPSPQPGDFLLVPLQMEFDTNLVHHAPAQLRTMQALVDRLSTANPPWPMVFKQHPADARRGNRHLKLKLRRGQDRLWPQSRGDIHAMLRAPGCRGVVTINSNTAHDALVWDVPAIVLGRNLWPDDGRGAQPFLTQLPPDWSELARHHDDAQLRACRRAYAAYLIDHQWTLADAGDADRVQALLESAWAKRETHAPPRAAGAVPIRRDTRPLLNVVAENRGWLFEAWKRAYREAGHARCRVVASERPLREADGWLFIRAREAALSPDFARSIVQIHDFAGAGHYAAGAPRAAVRRCAGIALTHPAQRAILEAAGFEAQGRRWLLQAVGRVGEPRAREARGAGPLVLGWAGRGPRPEADSGFADLCAALESARLPLRLRLHGSGLEACAQRLRACGIACELVPLRDAVIARCADWLAAVDALVLTDPADSGPWPLFDALAAGVPVIARGSGWAQELLAGDTRGRVVRDRDELDAALRWLTTTAIPLPRDAVFPGADWTWSRWIDANLDFAATLLGDRAALPRRTAAAAGAASRRGARG
ncbi:capsular polysaccharide export protein, LipB/KpsS family [Solimonas soli]|uniref:capsular polysaccharide export protein, LipB/KpsS family n=1 Tax=Solimonas soli TaxID=413479 RepID=UPI000483219C|nr:glycosyltransferase [Solimonas soli]